MKTNTYLRLCVFAIVGSTMVGVLIPWLVSQKDDFAVAAGVCLLLTVPWASYKFFKALFKEGEK